MMFTKPLLFSSIVIFLLTLASPVVGQNLIGNDVYIYKNLGGSSSASYHIGNANKNGNGQFKGSIIFEVIQHKYNGGYYARYLMTGNNSAVNFYMLEENQEISSQRASISLDLTQSNSIPVYFNTDGSGVYKVIVKSGNDLQTGTPGADGEFQYFSDPTQLGTALGVLEESPPSPGSGNHWSKSSNIVSYSGKVGVGTSSVDHQLEVNGTAKILPATDQATLYLDRASGQASIKAIDQTTNGHLIVEAATNDDAVYVNNFVSADTYLNMGGGRVGIGTTNPGANLEVTGSTMISTAANEVRSMLRLENDDTGSDAGVSIDFDIRNHTGSADMNKEARIILSKSGSYNAQANRDTQFDIELSSDDAMYNALHLDGDGADGYFSVSPAGTERLRINSNGKVGIGTSNPSEELEVNGTIRSKEIKVEAANWPDFVFEKNYDLATLAETNRYIKEYGHLPEIPSANIIAEEGVALGEMNRLLLKKIEELTLHLIKKEEEILTLGTEMRKMSEEMAKLSAVVYGAHLENVEKK